MSDYREKRNALLMALFALHGCSTARHENINERKEVAVYSTPKIRDNKHIYSLFESDSIVVDEWLDTILRHNQVPPARRHTVYFHPRRGEKERVKVEYEDTIYISSEDNITTHINEEKPAWRIVDMKMVGLVTILGVVAIVYIIRRRRFLPD